MLYLEGARDCFNFSIVAIFIQLSRDFFKQVDIPCHTVSEKRLKVPH